jgi:hypothetical protein
LEPKGVCDDSFSKVISVVDGMAMVLFVAGALGIFSGACPALSLMSTRGPFTVVIKVAQNIKLITVMSRMFADVEINRLK